MKTMKKAISMLVLFAMLASTLSGMSLWVFAATSFDVDKLVEAESGVLGSIEKTKDVGSSGGYYITVSSGSNVNDAKTLAKPDAAYTFNIPADGTYHVFIKVKIPTGGNDSYHWKWDSGDYTTVHPGEKGANYVWLDAATAPLKKGTHTFYWCHREAGAWVDALFVTTDSSKLPALGTNSTTSTSTAKPTASTTPKTSAAPVKGTGINTKAKLFTTVDGSVMFEAEDTTIDTKLVAINKEDKASGGKSVEMSSDNRVNPDASATGGLEFNLATDKAGKYSIWIRYVSRDGGNDSSWSSVNGAAYKDTALPPNSKNLDDYKWVKYNSFGSLDSGKTYNFRIIPREIGAKIDKFIVTTSGFTPTDMGTLPKPGEVGAIVKLDENAFPKPSITPPPEHPRLLFKKSDIPAIKANMAASESVAALSVYNQFLADTSDGILADKPGSYNFDGKLLGIIEAKALEYAVNGNQDYGKQALSMIKNVLKTVTFYKFTPDPERPMGQVIFAASEVYDWCFPLLTEADKAELVAACENIAQTADGGTIMGMEIGWPPKGQGAVTGHGGEAQLQRDLLSFGIATYDEYPDIYNYVGGRFLQEWPKTRNYWATSNTQHQGSAYGPYRYNWDLWGQVIIQKMSGQKIYIPDAALTSYQWIYTRRPDGQLLREGDDFNESTAKGAYWNVLPTTLFFSANLFKDPYLKKELLREDPNLASFNYSNTTITPSLVFLLNDPSIVVKPLADLPLTKYFASPVGQMVARTGWNDGINAPDALAFMKIGEVWAANHNHLDIGNFQIYYKGILASESGYYDSYYTPEDKNYNKQTIAHNSLLIFDPNEQMLNSIVNSGGQRIPGNEVSTMDEWMKNDNYKMATVIGHEFGPDPVKPAYTYLAGDITKAYSDKVKQVLRSMIFMPLQDADHAAAFIVMDKITSSKPEFKKTFLLHSQQEPEINGNVSIIKRDTDGYNGMLTNQTLLPKNAKITKVGGADNEYNINDTNYPLKTKLSAASSAEAGWGRIEVSPAEANATDYFLNVMYVSDADKNLPVSKATLIETDKVAGAKLLDRVAVFAKDSKRLEKEVTFKIDGSESALNINVAGLKEGTWSVSVNGTDIGKQVASKDGGIIYFTAPAGDYKLTYADANAIKPIVTPAAQNNEGIDIKVGKQFIYSDVPATVINDRTLVPMRAIFEALQAKVTWDDATLTATAVKGNTEVKITQDSATAYINGEAKQLDVPASVIDDRFMVPVRFVSEAMGAKVDWDAIGQYVIITPGKGGDTGGASSSAMGPIKDGVAQIISSEASEVYQETYPNLSYDGDPVTLWSAEGTAEWISYEFKDPATILSVYVLLNKATERQAYFDIQSSTDGETYTTVLSCTSDKKSEGELFTLKAPVTSKYFRIFCKGNSVSAWNAIKEIEFRTK